MKVNKMKKYYIDLELKTIVDDILDFHLPFIISKEWIVLSILIFRFVVNENKIYSSSKLTFLRCFSIRSAGVLLLGTFVLAILFLYMAQTTLNHQMNLLFREMQPLIQGI